MTLSVKISICRRKLNVRTFSVLAICMCLAFVYLINRFVMFENVDRSISGSFYAKMAHLTRAYPSDNEISTYLSDATLLLSRPHDNRVYYFDDDHNYILWRDNIPYLGTWSSAPFIKIMTFEGRWRITTVNLFCNLPLDIYNGYPVNYEGNCYVVELIDQLFAYSHAAREYRNGNIFKLSKSKVPFPLPSSDITIDHLLAITPNQIGAHPSP